MLNHDGDTPVYMQLAEILRMRLRDRPAGAPMPSEVAIQLEFGVARTTARRAIRVLREEGLVYTVQGMGAFVGRPDEATRTPRKVPIYRQMADEIIARILRGELRPLRPVPSETTLVQQYGVARETARQVAALLRREGWVYTVPQRGTYVSPKERWPTTGPETT
ncbi:GntR family transcriptional regulator [Sphaerimonospora mesophila]|uniref:GntR family transcriptional regulator n=1 Tax=Sphaerimonospora mesophila TaxID=37483 RepID=UPI0006E3FEAB